MLEIGTSGSVRGGDGNIPAYSAIFLSGGSDVTQEGGSRPKWFQGGRELQLSGIVVPGRNSVLDRLRSATSRSKLVMVLADG